MMARILNIGAMYLIKYLFLPPGLQRLLILSIWVPLCWSGFLGGEEGRKEVASTIPGSTIRSLMKDLNLPSYLKRASQSESEQDHPKICFFK